MTTPQPGVAGALFNNDPDQIIFQRIGPFRIGRLLDKILDWIVKPIVSRNIEDALEKRDGHTLLDRAIRALHEWRPSEVLPDGFWWGVFAVLAVWGAAEVYFAYRRRVAEACVIIVPERGITSEQFGAGLYAAEMVVSTGALERDRYIQINARCFNATGHAIFLDKADGHIEVSKGIGGSSKQTMTLPPPMLIKTSHKSNEIQDKEEFSILLEQRIPSDLAESIMAVTFDQWIGLELRGLSVMVTSHSDPRFSAKLPLWDGITLRRWPPERIVSNRVIMASLGTASFKVTAGR